ncbi:MAG TPA: hypothetical protein ENJ08_01285 [Gammaproteobacteria bacterium]|nr:hypothetical protein [Gammaproteobacteria bacterium]
MTHRKQSIQKRNFYRFFVINCRSLILASKKHRELLLTLLLCLLPSVATPHQGLVFLDFIGFQRDGLEATSSLPENDFVPQATFFYTGEAGGVKLQAEFLANDIESQFGRLQIGFSLSPSHNLWLGRTDNPASYWRDQYHHGGWLQPTITRPGISEYEVSGGIVPSHTTGIMLEGGSALLSNQNFGYVVTAGYGPELDEDGLKVPELSIRDRGSHNASYAFRTFYKFDGIAHGNEIGLSGSLSHIAAEQKNFTEVEQLLVAAYVNWNFGDLEIISEFVELDSDTINLNGTNVADDHFHNLYIQGVYALTTKWNLYARAEDTSNASDSTYLVNFPDFVSKRDMLGINYNLTRNQTIKLEVDRTERLSNNAYNQLTVQWSLVYP